MFNSNSSKHFNPIPALILLRSTIHVSHSQLWIADGYEAYRDYFVIRSCGADGALCSIALLVVVHVVIYFSID